MKKVYRSHQKAQEGKHEDTMNLYTQNRIHRTYKHAIMSFVSVCGVLAFLLVLTPPITNAAPNYQMNYQGKLTNASNVAVGDGTYNMRFWLLASSTVATTSALWTESLTGTNRVQVTNGLFSVMLGSTTPLTGVNFNQTLYLGVEIGGTSTPAWDGEMSPRKVLGTVPAAFEAHKLDGLDSTQFVRTDATSTIATSSANTLLTLTQNGVGDIFNMFDGTTEVFTMTDGGRMGLGTTSPSRLLTMQGGDFYLGGNMTATGTLTVSGLSTFGNLLATNGTTTNATSTNLRVSGLFTLGSDAITDLTGSGLQNTSNALTCITATGAAFGCLTSTDWTTFMGKVASSSIDSSAELAALVTDETGIGSLVFSGSPVFTGGAQFAGIRATASSTLGYASSTALTVSGNTFLTYASSTALSVSGNSYFTGNVGIGTTTPSAKLAVTGTAGNQNLFAFASSTGSNLLTLGANGRVTFGNTATSNILMNGGATSSNPFLGDSNVAIGNKAFSYYAAGAQHNIALGQEALYGSSSVPMTGTDNFAAGYQALMRNTTGNSNFAAGYQALTQNTTGNWNNALGQSALAINTAGSHNNAFGINTLESNTTGSHNNAFGQQVLQLNQTGSYNNAFGWVALSLNTTGSNNNAIGAGVLQSNRNGSYNIGIGYSAGSSLGFFATSSYNTYIGYLAGDNQTQGDYNLVMGTQAGYNLSTATSTTLLGAFTDVRSATGVSSSTALGAGAFLTLSNTMVLGGTGSNAVDIVTGTSTPWAKLSIMNTYGSTNALFDIATTTSSTYATSSIFRVGHNGKIGIGTTSPYATLTIAGTMGLSGALYDRTASAGTNGMVLQTTGTGVQWVATSTLGLSGSSFTNSSQLAALLSDETGSGFAVFSGSPVFTGGAQFAGINVTASSTLGFASSTALSVSGNSYFTGNVGIGTTSPLRKFDVFQSGSGVISQFVADGTNASILVDIRATGVTPKDAAVRLQGADNWTFGVDSTTGGFGIYNGNNYPSSLSAAVKHFSVTTAGNVGIGTTTPWAKLSIMNTYGATTPLFDIATTTSATYATSSLFRVNHDGNIGIGTSTPGQKLDVYGNVRATGVIQALQSGGNNYMFTMDAANAGGPRLQLGNLASPSSYFEIGAWNNVNNFDSKNRDLRIYTTGGALLSLSNTNTNVGIGTTTPSAKFSIEQGMTGTGNLFQIASSSNGTATTTHFMINQYGNVGIGTTTPYAKLTIAGTMGLSGALYDRTASAGTNGMVLQTTGTGVQWVATSTLGLSGSSFTNSSQLAALLSDETGSGFAVFSGSPVFTGGAQFVGINVTASSTLGYASSTALSVSGNTYLTGNVGIGTTTPSAKLAVTGTAGNQNLFAFASSTGSNLLTLGANGRVTFGNTATSNILMNGGATSSNPFLGNSNVAIGNKAFSYYAAGAQHNIAIGGQALYGSSSVPMTGIYNFAGGYQALMRNTTGGSNNAFGGSALSLNTTGNYNNALGYLALMSNTTGSNNNALGNNSLMSNTTGSYNNAFGGSLNQNTTGSYNGAFGSTALFNNTTGSYNNALGFSALLSNITGSYNTGIGYNAGWNLGATATSSFNTYIGFQAGINQTQGDYNLVLGTNAGYNLSTATSTTLLGAFTDVRSATGISSSTALGAGALLARSNTMVLGGTGSNAVDIVTGTSTPWAKLSIMNTYGATTPLFDIATTTSSTYATSSIFRVNHDGKIGIGTTSPYATLTIAGTMGLSGAFYDRTASAGTNGMVLQTTGTGVQWVATSTLGFGSSFTNSSQLAALLSDETGSGFAVFSGSPVFTGGAQFAGIRASASSTLGFASSTALTVSGAFYDRNASAGTSGMVLRTTNTGVEWVATSSLGLPTVDRSQAVFVIGEASSTDARNFNYTTDRNSDDVQINAAIAALPAAGGMIVLREGVYVVSDYIGLTSSTTLYLSDGAVITIPDNYSPTTFSVNSRTIKSIVTNADHTNGDQNVRIMGNGRITAVGTSQSDTTSWMGVYFHKVEHGLVQGIEIDHILDGIAQNGGSLGTERFYAIGFSETNYSTVDRVNTHHTGDDTINIHRSSSYNTITHSDTHHSTFGHGVQISGGQALIFGTAGFLGKGNIVSNNFAHDAVDQIFDDNNSLGAGIVIHGGQDTTIINNTVSNNGAGIVVNGDAQNSTVSNNNIYDSASSSIWVAPDSLSVNGINDVKIVDNLITATSSESRAIYVMTNVYGVYNIDITGNKINGSNANEQSGIVIVADDAPINRLNIVNNSCDEVGAACIYLSTLQSSAEIANYVISSNSLNRSGYGVLVSEVAGQIAFGLISGNYIGSARTIGASGVFARGIYLNGNSSTTVSDNRIVVAGVAMSEYGTAQGNNFMWNDASLSGSTTPQLLGSVSKYADNSNLGFHFSTNVGIGTTTPYATLTIAGTMGLSGAFYDRTASAGTNGMVLQTTSTGVQWVATSTLGLSGSSFTNSSQLAALLSDETGSGFAVFSGSPVFTGGAQFAGIRASASSTLGYASSTSLTVTGNTFLTYASSTALSVSGNTYLTGNVGIGTTTPSAKLALTGTAGSQNLFAFASSTGSNLLTLGANGRVTFGNTATSNILMNGGATSSNPFLGNSNVAIGNKAFSYYTTGASYNIALGDQALYGSSTVPTTGVHNFAAGYQALMNNTTGKYNNALGLGTLYSNTTGSENNAIGLAALLNNTTGSGNNAFGTKALVANTTGSFNNAFGTSTLLLNTTGNLNNAIGYLSLANNTTGSGNTAIGVNTMLSNTIGAINNAIGYNALYSNSSGSFNDAFGYRAGYSMTTGTSTLFLGRETDTLNGNISSSTALGAGALLRLSNTMVLGGTGSNAVDIVTGTSTPWAKLSIMNTYGSTTPLFDIATTTSSTYATSSIFRVGYNGNVGIGTTTPISRLTIDKTAFSGSGVAGLKEYYGFTNSVLSAVYYGNEMYIDNTPTATSTLSGKSIKIVDNSALGNAVYGMTVNTYLGANTQGVNIGVSAAAKTIGMYGITTGTAGSAQQPAGVFAQTLGTTLGNALLAYSNTITTESLVSLFHNTSNFIGTGLSMDFAVGGGSFAATSSAKFLDFKVNSTSKFIVAANGSTTIGDGSVNAGLRIPRGGICVDSDGSCVSTTTGQIRSVTSALGNSDLAEMYFSNQSLTTGEIVSLSGGLSVNRASEGTKEDVIGVVSTKPGMTLGFDDTSLVSGETAYPVGLKGRVPIKLSTENGPITKGDRITLSSIPGVGMKASTSSRVVGIALEDYDGTLAYSAGYINQFGDDMVKEKIIQKITIDPKTQDGCYYSGGNPLDKKPCVPQKIKNSTKTIVTDNAEYREMIATFTGQPSEEEVTESGEVVHIGQAIMFIELGWYQVDRERMVLSELATTSPLFEGSDVTLWDSIKALASHFVDGVLSITGLKADRVEVKDELCVDGVCVTADDLRAILQSTRGGAGGSESTPTENETGGSQTGGGESDGEGSGETNIDTGNTPDAETPTEPAPPTPDETPVVETPIQPETPVEPAPEPQPEETPTPEPTPIE